MSKVKNFKKFLDLSKEKKKLLLLALGYKVDEKGFIRWHDSGRKVQCRYTKRPVHFNESSILPGSTIVINTTPTSLSKYIEEYLE
jgi:hypothetical protein